jgi:hypothetical protein
MKLHFLNRHEIDINKWNDCINESPTNIVYPYAWYLDIVAPHWSAIISENYECVMPIVWNRKFTIKYCFRPFLVQQLGILCKKKFPQNNKEWLKILNKNFVHIVYNFNYNNNIPNSATLNSNFILSLDKKYEVLYKNYTANNRYYTKKSQKNNIQIINNLDIDTLIDFKKKNAKNYLTEQNFYSLKKLASTFSEKTIINAAILDDQIVSAFLIFTHKNKFYYLVSATNQQGRKVYASFLLLDNFIKKFSNSNYILDFEGSNLPGVARFFMGWGASEQKYPSYKKNIFTFKL